MEVYIVTGHDANRHIIMRVCDTEFMAMKMKTHFEISSPELIYEITWHAVMIEAYE